MILDQDFEDFVSLLNKRQVEYMVVGGYALAFHGKPRHTGDLDIWINVNEQNAERMVQVMKDFGVSALGFTKKDFLKPGYISQIGYPPLRIDVLNSIDGVEFAKAYPNRIMYGINDDLIIAIIGLRDLLENKQATGRAQDIADIKQIADLLKNTPAKRKSIRKK